MVIRTFVLALLGLAFLSYFVPVEEVNNKNSEEDIALLTFNESTMYTLTPANMNRVVKSKKVIRFKDRDVLYDGELILKGKDKENNILTDVLVSDVIIKRDDIFSFINNVKFKRNDFLTLKTNELIYDSKTKIATNTLPFDGTYFNNTIQGETIYLDLNKYQMKSKNVHFEVEVQR